MGGHLCHRVQVHSLCPPVSRESSSIAALSWGCLSSRCLPHHCSLPLPRTPARHDEERPRSCVDLSDRKRTFSVRYPLFSHLGHFKCRFLSRSLLGGTRAWRQHPDPFYPQKNSRPVLVLCSA